MNRKGNTFFSLLIIGCVVALLSSNFNPQVPTLEAQVVSAEEGESKLPPLPEEPVVLSEAPVPDQEDAVDVETLYEEFVEEANDVVCEPVLIKEDTKTKRRGIFNGGLRKLFGGRR